MDSCYLMAVIRHPSSILRHEGAGCPLFTTSHHSRGGVVTLHVKDSVEKILAGCTKDPGKCTKAVASYTILGHSLARTLKPHSHPPIPPPD